MEFVQRMHKKQAQDMEKNRIRRDCMCKQEARQQSSSISDVCYYLSFIHNLKSLCKQRNACRLPGDCHRVAVQSTELQQVQGSQKLIYLDVFITKSGSFHVINIEKHPSIHIK
jgi:hypothetical protein